MSITLGATDPDSSPLTFRIVSGPSHGSLSGSGRNRTYTPSSGYSGPDSFRFLANDGKKDSNVATVSITHVSSPPPPVANNQSVTLNEDESAFITLTANDPDDCQRLKFSIVTGPAHGKLVGNLPWIVYSPDPNYNGTDSFTFRAQDGDHHVSNVGVVTLTIKPVNDQPLASNLRYVTARRTAITGQLVGTDIDGDTLTYRLVDRPDKGTVTLNRTTGAFTYTPNSSTNGSDSFSYTVNDGHLTSDVATVHIDVRTRRWIVRRSRATCSWKARARRRWRTVWSGVTMTMTCCRTESSGCPTPER